MADMESDQVMVKVEPVIGSMFAQTPGVEVMMSGNQYSEIS